MLKGLEHFKKYSLWFVIVFVLTLCSYATVNAMTLHFDQINDGGTLTYDGNGGVLEGRDIIFESVTGLGTPLNSGVTYTISDGLLDFDTGDLLDFDPGLNFTEPDEWTFASGGYFTLTGTVSNGTITETGTLLSGKFTSIIDVSSYGSGSFISVVGFGEDTKNQVLLDFYGIDSLLADNFNFLTSNLSASVTDYNSNTGQFSANVDEADIINSVPDASIMLLLGPSLLCLGMLGRRKFKSEEKRI